MKCMEHIKKSIYAKRAFPLFPSISVPARSACSGSTTLVRQQLAVSSYSYVSLTAGGEIPGNDRAKRSGRSGSPSPSRSFKTDKVLFVMKCMEHIKKSIYAKRAFPSLPLDFGSCQIRVLPGQRRSLPTLSPEGLLERR